jgi:tetratricopeptide (TPR) repeat protein
MKYAPLAVTLLLAACGGTMPEIRPLAMAQSLEMSPYAEAYQSGKAHLMADRVGLAIVMFEKALAFDPLSVAALNAIGTAYDELHRPEVAKAYYVKALAIEPNSADTLNNMAVSAAMAGDEAAAHDLFARAAQLAPANSTISDNIQVAGMTPQDDLASLPDADANRPRLERTGLSEITLTIPATVIETWTLPAPTKLVVTENAAVVERPEVAAITRRPRLEPKPPPDPDGRHQDSAIAP